LDWRCHSWFWRVWPQHRSGLLPSFPGGERRADVEAYSRFDFVPGEKVIAFEDFAQDSIGDFPAKWNTNASGEIVTIANRPRRWVKLTGRGVFVPEFLASLPENFTLEYDLLVAPRLAVGAPDTRNKLLTEGKWVTHGILFDVNSDKVKAESYGALKEISNLLSENAAIKVQIAGTPTAMVMRLRILTCQSAGQQPCATCS
jgi:hypothetical protein